MWSADHFCSLVAFAFARLRWRGRDTLFIIMLATMMLPTQVTLVPQFIIYRYLGWIDTYFPLILPNWFGGPFLTFLLRQFFMSIPLELDDAARIDGATIFGIYWRIILPLSKPGLAAVGIFTFNASWNDFRAAHLPALRTLHPSLDYAPSKTKLYRMAPALAASSSPWCRAVFFFAQSISFRASSSPHHDKEKRFI